MSVLLIVFTIVVGLVLAVFGLVVAYFYNLHRRYDHLPGPKRSSFFFGHLSLFKELMKDPNVSIFVDVLLKWRKEYGPTYVMWMMRTPMVVTTNTEAIKELLITGRHPKNFDIDIRTLYGVRFLGDGLVSETNDDIWRVRRSLFNPAFGRGFLRSIVSDFNSIADQMMNHLAELADGQTVVRLDTLLHHATLDVIGKVAFGRDIESLADKDNEFSNAVASTMAGMNAIFEDYLLPYKFWAKRAFKKEVRKNLRFLRSTAKQWISERREAMERGDHVPDDILTHMIQAPDFFENEEVYVDDFVTFFIAGQETTANALGFSFMELGRNPEILDNLKKEVDDTIGSKSGIDFDDLSKLDLTGRVFKESLRLYPPSELTMRDVGTESFTIDGYAIPKGTLVMLSTYINSRLPELNPDPLTFDPDRHKMDAENKPGPYSMFPFIIGPRNCIGQNFAQMEAKVILAKFVQRFNFKLHPEQEFGIMQSGTLRVKGSLRCILTQRQNTGN